MLRAHVAARGGNALVGFRLDKWYSEESLQRNHAYCLVAFSGDAVRVEGEGRGKVNLYTDWPAVAGKW